jgi:hypothetical protein
MGGKLARERNTRIGPRSCWAHYGQHAAILAVSVASQFARYPKQKNDRPDSSEWCLNAEYETEQRVTVLAGNRVWGVADLEPVHLLQIVAVRLAQCLAKEGEVPGQEMQRQREWVILRRHLFGN